MSQIIEVTKVNNEKIAINLQYVMTVQRSDNPNANSIIQFPPTAGAANNLYVQEDYETVLAYLKQ